MAKMTNAQLLEENASLRAALEQARRAPARIAPSPRDSEVIRTDNLGRRYRQTSWNVKTFLTS